MLLSMCHHYTVVSFIWVLKIGSGIGFTCMFHLTARLNTNNNWLQLDVATGTSIIIVGTGTGKQLCVKPCMSRSMNRCLVKKKIFGI